MKKMMNRFKAILEENILLLLLVIGVWGGVFLLAWNSSIRWCTTSVQTVDAAYEEFWKDTENLGPSGHTLR